MSLPAERSARRLAAKAILATLVVLAVIPGYVAMDRSWRPTALRLGGTVLVIVACGRAVRALRRSIEEEATPSALDAPAPESPAPELDNRFLRLRDDVVFSTRNQRYFESILWPRLKGLADGNLAGPPAPRGRRRGPSPRALETVIAAIERRG
jgi:hypothetical protein